LCVYIIYVKRIKCTSFTHFALLPSPTLPSYPLHLSFNSLSLSFISLSISQILNYHIILARFSRESFEIQCRAYFILARRTARGERWREGGGEGVERERGWGRRSGEGERGEECEN